MTTDEGRELLCNIQGPIAARLIAISQARFAAGGSTNIISIFRRSSRPICRSLDSLQEMAGPPPSPCASHSEVSGRLGTRKFDQMPNQNLLLPNQAPPNPATTCLVRLLVPNLCSYKRLANGAVKIISAKRIWHSIGQWRNTALS